MSKKNETKTNVVLTALLVIFVCLLSFGIGVISGKGWSDREYKVRHIQQDTHLQMAMSEDAEDEAVTEDMTDKEIEMLTQRAMEEARAQTAVADQRQVADLKPEKVSQENIEKVTEQNSDKAKPVMAQAAKPNTAPPTAQRQVSSVPAKVTMPPAKLFEYTVQVAAYKTLSEAEHHSQRLIDKGFPAFPVKAQLNGQEWFRVSIGSFKTRDQAIQYERNLQRQSVVKSTFVQKIQR